MKEIGKIRKITYRYMLVTLGFLSAFGPFVTDMYLPALPSLSKDFDTTNSLTQLSLTMSMLGLAIGQILIGTVSDKYGRRRLLVGSLIMYILATIGCIFSKDIMFFNCMRLFQGLAGAGGIVLSRSIATDMYSGERLTRFISMIATVNGIAPVVAPVIGGLLLSVTNWQGIFWVLLLIGVILLLLSLRLRESLPVSARLQSSVFASFKSYKHLIHNRTYVIHFLIYMFSAFVLFTYISSSTFILQDVYKMSSIMFSICFAINALSIGFGCSLAGRMHGRNSIRLGGIIICVAALLGVFTLNFMHSVVMVEANFILIVFGFGLLQPVPTALALDSERQNAGVASAAIGASGFVMGSIAAPITGMGDILRTTSIMFVTGAVLTVIAVVFSLMQKRPLPISEHSAAGDGKN